MKRLLISSALVVVAATGAMASGLNGQLPQTTKYEVRLLVPNANLDNLTVLQAQRISAVISSSEARSAGDDPAGTIRSILNQQ